MKAIGQGRKEEEPGVTVIGNHMEVAGGGKKAIGNSSTYQYFNEDGRNQNSIKVSAILLPVC